LRLLLNDRHRLTGLRIDDVICLLLGAHAAADRQGDQNGK
jgi:hypothetical protein